MVPTSEDCNAVHIRRPYPNENAFPYVVTGLDEFTAHPGLTKREYFAALAMLGLLNQEDVAGDVFRNEEIIGSIAVAHADALIEALQPQQS